MPQCHSNSTTAQKVHKEAEMEKTRSKPKLVQSRGEQKRNRKVAKGSQGQKNEAQCVWKGIMKRAKGSRKGGERKPRRVEIDPKAWRQAQKGRGTKRPRAHILPLIQASAAHILTHRPLRTTFHPNVEWLDGAQRKQKGSEWRQKETKREQEAGVSKRI